VAQAAEHEKPNYPVNWSKNVDASFIRGLVLLVVFFFVPHWIIHIVFSLGFPSDILTVKHGFQLVLIYVLELLLLAILLKVVGRISIVSFFRVRSPSYVEYLVCFSFGTLLGFLQFYSAVPYGQRLPDLEYVLFISGSLLLKSVLWPVIEEVIFRGIGFVTLFNYGRNRLTAYLGSTLLFLLFHAPSLQALFSEAALGLSNFHVVVIVSLSLFAAYVYEKTGKLLLCVFTHGVVNGMQFLGVIVGYMVDYPLPDDWPAN
jgi:membrane protease YdiL (CAAX protease family)